MFPERSRGVLGFFSALSIVSAVFFTSYNPNNLNQEGRAACTQSKKSSGSLLVVKLQCHECMKIIDDNSHEHFNILISFSNLKFWWLNSERTQFCGLEINESHWCC